MTVFWLLTDIGNRFSYWIHSIWSLLCSTVRSVFAWTVLVDSVHIKQHVYKHLSENINSIMWEKACFKTSTYALEVHFMIWRSKWILELFQFVQQLANVFLAAINSLHSSRKITAGWKIEVAKSSHLADNRPAKRSTNKELSLVKSLQRLRIYKCDSLIRDHCWLKGWFTLFTECLARWRIEVILHMEYLRAGGVILVPLRLRDRRVSASAAWARWLIAISKSSAVKRWFAMSSSCSVWLHFWVTQWRPALADDSPTLLLKYCPQNRHSSSAKSHTVQEDSINYYMGSWCKYRSMI